MRLLRSYFDIKNPHFFVYNNLPNPVTLGFRNLGCG